MADWQTTTGRRVEFKTPELNGSGKVEGRSELRQKPGSHETEPRCGAHVLFQCGFKKSLTFVAEPLRLRRGPESRSATGRLILKANWNEIYSWISFLAFWLLN